jgi:hypothetical protein
MYLGTCGNFKSTNHKKDWAANRKSAKSHICGRSANRTNYLNPQFCGFAICGTYLRIAHLWKTETAINVINIFSKLTL